ncbi:LUD domain-containing protein [Rhodocytophaga aerolata]|uniref:LUD domain-containing protein n=1 Tax=Rhodocytophaga aerolata TaxID=455078 RepID=A0ABT8R2I2_9BACT|nr:LUD domain-containing protein [Rhodocytophaga aerolata]MDO1446134.1 LUD domain-containing protein [Rhodocytophaga aerolata]
MPSSQSRENILNRIRAALQTPTDKHVPKPDFSASIYSQTSEEPSILFAQTFIKNKGEFYFCENAKHFLQQLQEVIAKKNITELYAWEDPLKEILSQENIPHKTDDRNFTRVEAGLTLCECLIARTGGVMVSSRQLAGRRLTIYPPVHMVVAYTSQILLDIKDSLQFLQEKYPENIPSMISMIAGPSRTADIEKTLVLGAHGPKELVLFLVEDQL